MLCCLLCLFLKLNRKNLKNYHKNKNKNGKLRYEKLKEIKLAFRDVNKLILTIS